MKKYTDQQEFIDDTLAELARKHTWSFEPNRAWLIQLMNSGTQPLEAAFLLAEDRRQKIMADPPFPANLAEQFKNECSKRCTVTAGQVTATVTLTLCTSDEVLVKIRYTKPIAVLTDKQVRQLDPTIHPDLAGNIGKTLSYFPTAITIAKQNGAAVAYTSATREELALEEVFHATYVTQQNALPTVELVKKRMAEGCNEVNRTFVQIEKEVTAHYRTFVTELKTSLLARAEAEPNNPDPIANP